MARRARFPINIPAVCLILIACTRQHAIEVPGVFVDGSDKRLHIRQGFTCFNDTPFSGWIYGLHPGGDTAYRYGFFEGKREGPSREWFPGGGISELRWYRLGRKTGLHRGWYANGNKKFELHLRDDYYEGNVKEWFENGQLARDFNYRNGQEEGLQRMYWENGRVRMNYQCKNGRKYGLTGVKSCISVWADGIAH